MINFFNHNRVEMNIVYISARGAQGVGIGGCSSDHPGRFTRLRIVEPRRLYCRLSDCSALLLSQSGGLERDSSPAGTPETSVQSLPPPPLVVPLSPVVPLLEVEVLLFEPPMVGVSLLL